MENIAISVDALAIKVFNSQIYEEFTLSEEPLLLALRSDIDYLSLPKPLLRKLIDVLSSRNIICALPTSSHPVTCESLN